MTDAQNQPPDGANKPKRVNKKNVGNLDDTPTTKMFSIAAILVFGGLLPLILWSLVSDNTTQDVPDILMGKDTQLSADKMLDEKAAVMINTGDEIVGKSEPGKPEYEKARTMYDEAINAMEQPLTNDNKIAQQSRISILIRAHKRRAEFFKRTNKADDAAKDLAEVDKLTAKLK